MSRESKRQPSGKSYFYIEKLPLWVPLFVLTLGASSLTGTFLHLFENNPLNTIVGFAISVALIALGIYTWVVEMHVDFDGVRETLSIREFRGGKLHSEKKHPFQVFSGVRIKEQRRSPKSVTQYYAIALSRGLDQLPLPGARTSPEKLKKRRNAIAEVLGLP